MHIRDKEMFVLFTIGFAFVFILLCSGYSSISGWLWQYKKQTVEYPHSEKYYIHSKNSYDANYQDNDLLEEQGYVEIEIDKQAECFELCGTDAAVLVDIISNQSDSVYITNFGIDVGQGGEYDCADVVFSYQDEWYRELAEGEYPDVGDNSKICTVIGENLLSETYMRDGKRYIWIGDMHIEVCGVFENYNASDEDYSLVIFGGAKLFEESDAMKDKLAEYINNDWLEIIMGSSDELVAQETFENDIGESENLYLGGPGFLLQYAADRSESGPSRDLWDYLYNIKSMIVCVMVIFGIMNCIMLSRVWAVRREKDFLIMRIYGLGNRKIASFVLKELSVMAGVGMAIAVTFSVIYISVTDGWHTSEHMAAWLVLVMAIGLLVTLAVCTLSVFLYANRLKPAQLVRT